MENGHDSHPLSSFGTPIANSTRSLLSPRPGSSSSNHSTGSSSVSSSHRPLIQRLKGQDLYGGPVKFGGGNASNFFKQRRERLNAASPYASSKKREARKATSNTKLSSSLIPNHEEELNATEKGSSHSIAPSDAMSSTAKLILDTLERMSTPLRDARKIPVNPSPADMSRAEKRRLIAEELDSSLLDSPGPHGMKRKRPNLSSTGSSLCGPPVRTFFSPVLNRTKKKSVQQENPKVPGEFEKKDTSTPKLTNGLNAPATPKDLPSIASSIEAFKKTVDSSHSYGETNNAVAGGKLRIKDTMGPRSGRLPVATTTSSSSSCLPVKTPSVESNPLLSNGWTLPTTTIKSPLSESKPSPITPKLPLLLPPSSPRVEEKKIPTTTPIPSPLKSSSLPASITAKRPNDSEVSQVFHFSEPKKVVDAVGAKSDPRDDDEETILFTFSNPKILAEEPKRFAPPMVNGHETPIRKLPDITSFPLTTTTPILKAGSGASYDLVGSKGLLPDITAVPGQLKKGSVLSALSKMHDSSESKNARL